MADLFESLIWTDGQINPSGIKSKSYYIEKSSITYFPRITSSPQSATENVSLDGDFVLAPGKFWKEIYSTQGKGNVDWDNIGEDDSKMFVNKGKFKYPDINDSGKSIAKQFVNANCVFIVPMPHETEVRFVVLGDSDYNTSAKITGTSGDAPGSAKGLTIEVESPGTTPLPNYKGLLETATGSMDCSTGIFTESGR